MGQAGKHDRDDATSQPQPLPAHDSPPKPSPEQQDWLNEDINDDDFEEDDYDNEEDDESIDREYGEVRDFDADNNHFSNGDSQSPIQFNEKQ